MRTQILAAALLAASSSLAFAGAGAPATDIPSKEMQESPGVTGPGTTETPTAQPDTESLSGKAMQDQPGVNQGGPTADPTNKPQTGGLPDKAMKDHPGVGN